MTWHKRAAAAIRACRDQTFSMPSARIRFRLTRKARISVCAGVYGVSFSFSLSRYFSRSK